MIVLCCVVLCQMDRSPLHIAAEQGHTSVVEILTEKFKSCVLARTKVIRFSFLKHISEENSTLYWFSCFKAKETFLSSQLCLL